MTVRSRTSVENLPFLCQPPMGQTSFYVRFGSGVGHQRVLELLSCGSTAACMSPNTVVWGMEAQLCTDRVDGQDTETGAISQC